MPAFTPQLNLYLPGGGSLGIGGDDEVADVDKLNQNFQKIDEFAETWGDPSERTQNFKGPATGIGTVPSPALGDTYQETDGNKVLWKHDGANWVTNEGGMFLIRPSTVTGTGVTIETDGTIKFTNVPVGYAGASGVFSTRYRAYKIFYKLSGSTQLAARFVAGGTGVDDANYSQSYGYMGTTWVSATASPNAVILTTVSSTSYAGELTIYNPAHAETTRWVGQGIATNLPYFCGGEQAVTTAYDGIRFSTGAVSSGTIRILGVV